jgi:DNA-binding NarL/FixJ family response regulator
LFHCFGMTRIFLVDTHPLVRANLRGLLANAPDLPVVGEASPGPALLDQLSATPADVVLLGVQAPVPDCLATLRRLHAELASVRVLALLALGCEHLVSQLFEAGAHGCVLSHAPSEELLIAIRTVAEDRRFLCSELGIRLLRGILAEEPAGTEPKKPGPPPLTRRETEILRLLAEGLTTSEMAEKLFASKRTIETHRQNILEKTRTKNTAALIKLAMLEGLLD